LSSIDTLIERLTPPRSRRSRRTELAFRARHIPRLLIVRFAWHFLLLGILGWLYTASPPSYQRCI